MHGIQQSTPRSSCISNILNSSWVMNKQPNNQTTRNEKKHENRIIDGVIYRLHSKLCDRFCKLTFGNDRLSLSNTSFIKPRHTTA